jgi:hypothetical protein
MSLGEPTLKYDHDKVLDLWAAGHSGRTIAREMGMPFSQSAHSIISRARAAGDPRAVPRPPAPRTPYRGLSTLPLPTEDYLLREAASRNLTYAQFLRRLLLAIAHDDLAAAILDDTNEDASATPL